MPTMSFGSGPAKGLGFTGSSTLESRKFPEGTVIPYNGNGAQGAALPYSDTELSAMGWRRFTEANDCCLYAYTPTTLEDCSNLGRVDPQMNFSLSISGTSTSAGAHLGPNIIQSAYLTTGPLYAHNVSAGAHTHTYSGYGTVSTNNFITKNKRNFIIATRSQPSIPAYSIVSKENGFPIAQSTPIYAGATDRVGGAATNNIGGFLVGTDTSVGREVRASNGAQLTVLSRFSTSGGHTHSGTARKTVVPGGQRFYAYATVEQPGGAHTHPDNTWTAIQTKIACKLIDLYTVFKDTVPEKDLIVMYVNTVPPPDGWTWVSSLSGNIIGYENYSLYQTVGQWGKTIAHDGRVISGGGVATSNGLSHNHTAQGYSPANLASSSYSGIVTNAQHSNYAWPHTHPGNSTSSIQPFVPKKIWVGFIKYTGA